MPPVNKSDVRKQDFIVVKEKNNLDIAKIVAPHELQVGIEGFKGSSLRVAGNEYVAGSLEVLGGVKGALKLPDGTLALKAGTGVKVVDSGNGAVTLSLGSSTGGLETLIRPGDGLMAAASNGVVTLSLNRETTLPHFVEGAGVKINRLANLYTFSLDTSYIAASQAGVLITSGSGLIGTSTPEGLLSLSIDQSVFPRQQAFSAGSGISFATGTNGELIISSTATGSSAHSVHATDGITGSLVDDVLTLSLDRTGLALLEGSIFTGQIVAQGGLSGSLTTLADGVTPFLRAGTGIQLATGSDGQVEISSIAGSGAGIGTELVMNGSPTGAQDGVNLEFELAEAPADPSSFMLWLNGQLLTLGSDYSLDGRKINFPGSTPPLQEDIIRVMYSRRVAAKLYAMGAVPAQLQTSGDELTGLTLPNDPDPAGSLMLFLNGQLLTQGDGFDYTLSGRNVMFSSPQLAADVIRATYSYVA